MTITHTMINKVAMLALKRGEFGGHLVKFLTDKYGVTTVTEYIKEQGE